MLPRIRTWFAPGVAATVALAAGYTLPRPAQQGGDLLDAVAAVQRRSPWFLISEPVPPANWVRSGALYLCRTPRTVEDLEGLGRHPGRGGRDWAGVVCFKGTADPQQVIVPWLSDSGTNCFHYGEFAVFGDPDLLSEVRAILAVAGFHPVRDP